jgi:hypothetical protein
MKICIETDVDLGDLAWQIPTQSDPNSIIEFIKTLDVACDDWNITKKLYTYFKKEMAKLEKEKGLKNIQENN